MLTSICRSHSSTIVGDHIDAADTVDCILDERYNSAGFVTSVANPMALPPVAESLLQQRRSGPCAVLPIRTAKLLAQQGAKVALSTSRRPASNSPLQ